MGGYAAMLLGSRLGVAEVHAFAPQTFISRRLRHHYRDFRWQKQINHTWEATRGRRGVYQDIKPALRRSARRRPVSLHLHVGMMERDLQHARRVRRVPGIDLHLYESIADHNVAGVLNETGALRGIFEAAIARAENAS